MACGDDGGTKLIDSGIGNTDTPPKVCTNITPGSGDVDGETLTSFISFFNPINETVDGNEAGLFTEFYHSVTPNITGAIDLATGDQTDYATCGVCFLVGTADAQGNSGPLFFQQSGSVTFTEDPITARRLNVTVTNLKLQEATIDNTTFESTFVPTGDCVTLSGTFMEDNIPNDWATTCTAGDYYTGMPTSTCDCSCGVYDPDCRAPAAGDRTTGCTATGLGACWPDENVGTTCVARPANDTCATATTLVLADAAVTGNSIGASRDYTQPRGTTNTCTTFTQGGPDVVYKIVLTANQAYTFTVGNTDQSRDLSMTIIGPDANNDAAECVPSTPTCAAGRDAGGFGEPETASYTPTVGGTYYVIVDTRATTPLYDVDPANAVSIGGPFTIDVTSP